MNFLQKISCSIIIIFSLLIPISSNATTIVQGIGTAGNSMDTALSYIQTILSQLSCEMGGIASVLVTGEFSYTCISPIAMSQEVIYTLISPTWPVLKQKLKMNYDQLSYLQQNGLSQCHVKNRTDFNNPKVTFSFCSDTLLHGLQLASPILIIVDLIQGKSFMDALLDNIIVDPNLYHTGIDPIVPGHVNGSPGDWSIFVDPLSSPPLPLPWKVIVNQDTISVATLDILGTWIPVGSKLIKEPYPNSKYDNVASTGCQSINECFSAIDAQSQVIMGFSAKIIECTRQMLIRSLIDANLCTAITGQSIGSSSNNLFHSFQGLMYKTVSALLTLYIIFFGFHILLTGGQLKQSEIVVFLIKFVFVVYFSVGMTISGQHYDGITTYLIPLMVYGGNELASIVMNAGASASGGLCQYNPSDYPNGYSQIAMWDSLDCRVWNYLGLQGFFNFFNTSGGQFIDAMYTPIPFYLIMIVPALWYGYIQLALMLITFPFMVIGLAIYSVQAYIVCMISIILLSVLAPIFVPMALFEYTKGYFQSWYKLILSFALQPMVVTTFMVIMFNIFDQTFNHTCMFTPSTSNGKKFFIMNTDPDAYSSLNDFLECTKSLGFIFTPGGMVAQATGGASVTGGVSATSVANGDFTNSSAYQQAFPMLSIVQQVKGLFTNGNVLNPKGVVGAVKGVLTEFQQFITHIMFETLAAIIMLYVMKNLADQISEFAADMTEGISIGSLVMSPNKLNELKDKANDLYKKAKSGQLQKDIQAKAEEFGHKARAGSSDGSHKASASGGGHRASATSASSTGSGHKAVASDKKDGGADES